MKEHSTTTRTTKAKQESVVTKENFSTFWESTAKMRKAHEKSIRLALRNGTAVISKGPTKVRHA